MGSRPARRPHRAGRFTEPPQPEGHPDSLPAHDTERPYDAHGDEPPPASDGEQLHRGRAAVASRKAKDTKPNRADLAAEARGEVVGWRFWQLLTDGHLASASAWPQPWRHGQPLTARCRWERHPGERSPARDCECGVRVMPDLADLLRDMRRGINPNFWRERGGNAYYLDRARHGVLQVPDVFGQVSVWGRIEEGDRGFPRPDPSGTLRAEHALVGRILHLSAHLAHMAPRIRARYPHAEVHVGKARGLSWLEEIASAEGL